MESIQGKTLAALVIAAVALSGIVGGAATYALFPQVQTQIQTVEVEKPVYVYVNNTIYQNETVIEYRNNTQYVTVPPSYQGSDWFRQTGNLTWAFMHVQNLTFYLETNWSDPRVTKLQGYRYDFKCNGTHVLSNFTVLGPPNTLFGIGIILVSNEGFWIAIGEDYTNQAGEWTIPLRTIPVYQPWTVGISTMVNYNT